MFQQADSAGQVGVLTALDVPLISLAVLVAAALALALAVPLCLARRPPARAGPRCCEPSDRTASR